MKRKVIQTIKLCLALITLIVAAKLFFPTWTPGISGENSVSILKQIEINGAGHEVMIRGTDTRNPVLLFVHGGPGCSEIPYARKYQSELEKHFTIVHYDQRGSGKSHHFFEDYSNLTADLLVEDLLALTDNVAEMLEQEKVVLVGHSFGTYIGLKAVAKAPDKYAAYVGIGQVADPVVSELDSLAYTLEQARLSGNDKDAERLELLRESISQGKEMTPRSLVRKYGGAARLIDDNRDYYEGFLFGPEYNGMDVIRYLRGVSASQDALLEEERKHKITDLVKQVDLPVFFVMGQYDYMTSVNAAREYFDELRAPMKEMVVFEHSAHYPQFEEKERFAEWLTITWNRIAS